MKTNELVVVQEGGGAFPFAQADIDRVIEIVERATTTSVQIPSEKLDGRWIRISSFIKRHQRKVVWLTVVLSLLLGLLAFLTRYIDRTQLAPFALVVALAAVICGVLVLLSEIVAGIPFINELRSKPYAAFFRLLRATTSNDVQYLEELAQCEPAAVQYVLRHYQYHRQGQEKRGGTLAGNIDRIGLFPAVAAVALLWPTLLNSPFGSWLSMLVPLILAFHLLNLFGFTLQLRMDRIIALLEMSVSLSKR